MKVEGRYAMSGPREQVYAVLCDPEALRRGLPGCERFEAVGDGRYETALKAGIAGIKGSFTGTVTLSNEQPPRSYTLAMEGTFSGGFVKGSGDIALDEESADRTTVRYTGDVQISGPLASVGQRLLAPGVRMVVGQFFKSMDAQLKGRVTSG